MEENEIKFLLDVHLGKLARYLRMLGIDSIYTNDISNKELEQLAMSDNRILLSRNPFFSKISSISFYHITNEDPFRQFKQVAGHFKLSHHIQPFTRCIICNGLLVKQSKKELENLLQPNTRNFFNEFWQCSFCGHIYWKGSHYERMKRTIERLMTDDG
jgi:uncharacterized protein with PIN domain